MSKSGIEYCTDGWTPISGCLFHKTETCQCDCWAEKLRKRNPKAYPKGFYPAFHSTRLEDPLKLKGNKIIFTCHTGDAWGPWVKDEHLKMVLDIIQKCPQHTFLMLTKNPKRMNRFFSTLSRKVPDNVWLGTSITKDTELIRMFELPHSSLGGHRWVSFEPLLETERINKYVVSTRLKQAGIEQVVIGAQTNPHIDPKWDCFETIYQESEKLNIPIFIKNNLHSFLVTNHAENMFNQDLVWRK